MSKRLKYDVSTIASLGAVKVVVSKYVLDNQIVMRCPKVIKHPESAFAAFASFHTSIWNLDSGDIAGDCDPTMATEWHMSPYRFNQLKNMVVDFEHDKEMKRL